MSAAGLEDRSTPVDIRKKGGERLTIRWADGHESVFPSRYLRGLCPCAQCVSETTGRRIVLVEHVAEDVAIAGARTVGHYALQFDWSDGHATGIYSFDYLRRICPCDACAGAPRPAGAG
jgi:DUF971 family protein